MKTEINIEESARLIELGVDPKLASHKESNFYNGISSEEYKVYHLFALTDILTILPKEIDGDVLDLLATGYNKETDKLENGWTATYIDEQCIPSFGEDAVFSAPELIDSLNQLLIWAITNGHVKTEKK